MTWLSNLTSPVASIEVRVWRQSEDHTVGSVSCHKITHSQICNASSIWNRTNWRRNSRHGKTIFLRCRGVNQQVSISRRRRCLPLSNWQSSNSIATKTKGRTTSEKQDSLCLTVSPAYSKTRVSSSQKKNLNRANKCSVMWEMASTN